MTNPDHNGSSAVIPQLHALMTTLAVMKKAKEQGVNMCIWDRDIKAVEEALSFIEAMRNRPPNELHPTREG